MIGWQPRKGIDGPWHLTDSREVVSALCGRRVEGVERYVRRDPHKIDEYGGERCPKCWAEWRMRTGASLAAQDQYMAASTSTEGETT
jgi:hypothetical protein